MEFQSLGKIDTTGVAYFFDEGKARYKDVVL